VEAYWNSLLVLRFPIFKNHYYNKQPIHAYTGYFIFKVILTYTHVCRRREDDVKMDLKKVWCEDVDWFNLALHMESSYELV
jgi:hypothetical protein